MKHIRAAFLLVTVSLIVGMLAPGASARYTLHNGADMTETDVVDGSELNTCGDHISGRSAWSYFLDQPLDDTQLAAATSPAVYEVFGFPAGSDPFAYQFLFDVGTGQGSYVRFDSNGDVVDTATRYAFTTAPRVLIPGGPVFQPSEDDPNVGLYLYSSVAFDQAISPAAPVGSTLGMKPLGGASLRLLTVVDCTPPPSDVIASIDAQPWSSVNYVNPKSTWASLKILVKGSAAFNVSQIASAKAGGASPVTGGWYSVLSKPWDRNGDGYKDRIYVFRPSQTGLTCASTSVTIGGALTSGTAWKGTDTIKPIYC